MQKIGFTLFNKASFFVYALQHSAKGRRSGVNTVAYNNPVRSIFFLVCLLLPILIIRQDFSPQVKLTHEIGAKFSV